MKPQSLIPKGKSFIKFHKSFTESFIKNRLNGYIKDDFEAMKLLNFKKWVFWESKIMVKKIKFRMGHHHRIGLNWFRW